MPSPYPSAEALTRGSGEGHVSSAFSHIESELHHAPPATTQSFASMRTLQAVYGTVAKEDDPDGGILLVHVRREFRSARESPRAAR